EWIRTNIFKLDLSLLGKFKALIIDPAPWRIHMRLPYQRVSDGEIPALKIERLQDDGVVFLWCTARMVNTGLKMLEKWGYRDVERIVWYKTNHLNSNVNTGRTGHWVNHTKEVCLYGIKGNPELQRGLDPAIIVSDIRDTSHKPDTLYQMIERLVGPTGTKLELFGRCQNLRRGWLTVGDQLPPTRLSDRNMYDR
ncbi:MT-A70-like protein, partial [Geopyxis carbonaria]